MANSFTGNGSPGKSFPLPLHRQAEKEKNANKSADPDAAPAGWGEPPSPSESELYNEIAKEILEFRLDRKSANPRLPQLCEKYLAVQDAGPGEHWEGAPYLGLAHLIEQNVFAPDHKKKASQFSKWANRPPEAPFPFAKKDAQTLLHFLWLQPGWNDFNRIARSVSTIPDAYYFALIQALESGHATHEHLSHAAPGIYRCYRQSTLMPHLFLVGMLAVIQHGEALRTFEVHCFKDTPHPDGSGHEGRMPSMYEVYEGWMVKKSRQILIHAFDCATRAFHLTVVSNVLSSPPDFPVAVKPTRKTCQFQLMSGIATGVVGQLGFYSAPVVYTRLGAFPGWERPLGKVEADSDTLVRTVLETLERSEVSAQAYAALGMAAAVALPEVVRVQLDIVKRQYTRQHDGNA